MEKFTWETFRNKPIAVRCRTEAEAQAFLEHCRRAGFTWGDFAKIEPDKYTHHGMYGSYTCYIARADLTWIQFRSLSWVLEREFTVRFADVVMRELEKDTGASCAQTCKKESTTGKGSAPKRCEMSERATRWRDAVEDKPAVSGEYDVLDRWIADGTFHTGRYITMFNAESGDWGCAGDMDEYVITHWLDGVPPAPEVVVR